MRKRRLVPGAALSGVADFWFGPRAVRSKIREALGLASETVAMVTVARLTRCNGHLATLAALSNLRPSVRKRLSWLVVGSDGEADYVDELKSAIAASDCDVRLMAALMNYQIRDVYGASDLFCLTAKWDPSEPVDRVGLVYLEAAACGLPSIATAVGRGADTVIDNETGRLVEPSIKAIADAITELAMDGIKRISLGKRAWMRARAMNLDRGAADLSLPSGVHLERGLETTHGRSTIEAPK